MKERASDVDIARAIINLAEGGTDRIRALGGDCDDANRTYEPILAQLGLPLPPPRHEAIVAALPIIWVCDQCATVVPTRDTPCPVHGAPPPSGWCPF